MDETYQMRRNDTVPWVYEKSCGHKRCGCNSRLSMVKQQTGDGWVSRKFVEVHNYVLATPSRVDKECKVGPVFDPRTGLSVDNSHGQSLMFQHGMLAHATSKLVDKASLTDARNTFLLGEFQSVCVRVKYIDNGGDIGMSRSRSKSHEEAQVVRDPNPIRAKGYEKRLKTEKEKALSQTSRQRA
ncbi:Protein FAR1-RELATED SEQUENCE [Abeliophyllum distichum]|uniref:Protein FAR1-RELATED SEQUENCE n=1 Tax=Abeliophyllum distichum TaxID=126358 RepID=A0ABD1VW00_9LAMI